MQSSYDAEIQMLPFNNDAVDVINEWVDTHTDGMINNIVDDINGDSGLILLNASMFEANWSEVYEEYQIEIETFTNADGTEADVNMLSGTFHKYFNTGDAVGFMQYYDHSDYAFLAILPDEGVTVDEYVSKLTARKYMKFWNSQSDEYDVYTKMPEFSFDCSYDDLDDAMKRLGVSDVFDEGEADLSRIAGKKGDLFVSQAIHKSFIEVTRYGTRAGAVTEVEIAAGAAPYDEVKIREVYLDRPFVFTIVDKETGAPIFMGTVQNL